MEMSYHQIYASDHTKNVDEAKTRMILKMCDGVSENNSRSLRKTTSLKTSNRAIPSASERVHDAPEFRDNFSELVASLVTFVNTINAFLF
jgi:hypothetical protein